MIVVPSDSKTASNAGVYLESRSRMRNRTGIRNSMSRFLACWRVHGALGFWVRPRMWTRRVAC